MSIRELPVTLSLAIVLSGCTGDDSAAGGGVERDGGVPRDGSGGLDVAPGVDAGPVLTAEARAALRALRYDAAPPPADPSNRVADEPAARTWGQRLFFDAGFSGRLLESDNDGSAATLGQMGQSGRVACAGCHIPETGFVDTRSPHRQISLGAEWSQRRTPTLLDVAFAPLYNWDGRRDAIWNQAVGVMENRREFNSSRLFVAEQVFSRYPAEYEALFGALPPLDDTTRFPPLTADETGCGPDVPATSTAGCRGAPGDGADYDGMASQDQRAVTQVAVNTAKAMAAYVRQLRCGASRFDAWVDGDDSALDAAEQRGAALFVGRGRCVKCHGGPLLTDGAFHNVGMAPRLVAVAFTDTNDHGALPGVAAALTDLLSTTGPFSDGDRGALPAEASIELDGAFRTPSLRCLAAHPSYMHTAQMRTLDAVVAFFASGGDLAGYPGTSELTRTDLDESDRADLVAFLAALEGPGPDPALLTVPGARP
jgi:cytochrome c peroxidase